MESSVPGFKNIDLFYIMQHKPGHFISAVVGSMIAFNNRWKNAWLVGCLHFSNIRTMFLDALPSMQLFQQASS